MMYIVTVIKDIESDGVEIAGIFDTKEKADEVASRVIVWLEENEFEDYEVFAEPYKVNSFNWYDINDEM